MGWRSSSRDRKLRNTTLHSRSIFIFSLLWVSTRFLLPLSSFFSPFLFLFDVFFYTFVFPSCVLFSLSSLFSSAFSSWGLGFCGGFFFFFIIFSSFSISSFLQNVYIFLFLYFYLHTYQSLHFLILLFPIVNFLSLSGTFFITPSPIFL